MRIITARFSGTCAACGHRFESGSRIAWGRGEGSFHRNCAPSGDSKADAERLAGMREVDNWHENRRMFGDETADAMEIERELREGWD